MAIIKASMIFQWNPPSNIVKTAAPAGWSESVYMSGVPTDSALQTAFLNLATVRAAMLQASSSIVGARFDQISPNGPTVVLGLALTGGLSAVPDFPRLSLNRSYADASRLYRRLWQFRGMPDSYFVQGAWSPPNSFTRILSAFEQQLFNGNFLIQGINKSINLVGVSSIDAAGNVSVYNGVTVSSGTNIQLLRVKDAKGKTVSGSFFVESFIDAYQFKIRGWTRGACTGGQVRVLSYLYPPFNLVNNNNANSRMSTRKTGRPFFLSRGRTSKRR